MAGRLAMGAGALNYDTAYSLVWGQQLTHGHLPDYTAFGAPTPHPLLIVLGAIATAAGRSAAYSIMDWLGLIAGAVSLVALVRLGRAAGSLLAGLTGAAVLALSWVFEDLTVTASKDVIFLAVILVAAVLEAERPRRGIPVLALLAVAGLIRPDAWILSGLYWFWVALPLTMRERGVAAAVVLSAPLAWLATDLIVAGSPTFSLTRTQDLATDLGRPTGLRHVPGELKGQLSLMLGTAALLAGCAGAVLLAAVGIQHRRRWSPWYVPAALAAVGLCAFVGQGILGLPLTGRLLLLLGAGLAALTGLALTGWRAEPPGHDRTVWMVVAAAVAIGLLVNVPSRVHALRRDHARLARQDRAFSSLRSLAGEPSARSLLENCRRVALYPYADGDIQIPYLAHELNRDPDALTFADPRAAPPPALVLPALHGEVARAGLPPGDLERRFGATIRRMEPVAGNSGWTVYVRRGGCA